VTRVRLPVSGVEVEVRQPAGTEDVLLAEAATLDMDLALALVSAVTRTPGGAAIHWDVLPHTDLDTLLLLTRCAVFGDLVRAIVRCPAEECRATVAVAFSTAEYLDHHRPRPAPGIESDDAPGWWRLAGSDVRFRPPAAVDIAAVVGNPRPERSLLNRCVRPTGVRAATRRRVERAMERLAPTLVGELTGDCPECGAVVAMRFDPLQFCLQELSDQAPSVFEDIHLLASVYHWPEPEILALPRRRRARYADMAREERRST
jgi:hypothetical protein